MLRGTERIVMRIRIVVGTSIFKAKSLTTVIFVGKNLESVDGGRIRSP